MRRTTYLVIRIAGRRCTRLKCYPVSNLPSIEHLLSEIRNRLASTPGRPTPSGPPRANLYPPLSEAELAQEEARLGFNLPPLLGHLYTQVANGGFGPGGGLLTFRQLSPKVDQTIATMYFQFRTARAKRGALWQERVVPFASWGDMIFSCIDLSDASTREDPPVVRYEPNMSEAQTHAKLKGAPFRGGGLIPERERLSTWFEDWLEGREMFDRPYNADFRGALRTDIFAS